MLNQKIHFDLFNLPSKQTPTISFHTNNSKQQCFYFPCANLKKSPEKYTTNKSGKSRTKKVDLSSQNQSKYDCSKYDDLKTNNNNSVYFNEKNIIHSIKYKKSLENSKNDNDDSLNFTYFSKELGILHEKKPEKYHILKDFLSPFKKKAAFLKTLKKKVETLSSSKNDSNIQNSNISKKLPDISKENDNLDVGGTFSKELPNHNKKLVIAHKKNKALDYKPYNVLLQKKDPDDSKLSNGNTTQKTTQYSEQLTENVNKSKIITPNNTQEETDREGRISSWIDQKKPLSPQSVLKEYSHLLSNYEKSEILNYKEIFYLSSGIKNSNGTTFEDKKGYYFANPGDHVNYRYEIIEELGKGTFGKVFRVFDHKKHQEQALKIMKKEKIYYTQAINEIKVLSFIKEKDTNNSSNIVKMVNYFMFRNHVCIVFELLSISLYAFLKSNRFYGLSFDLIRKIGIQLFQTLTFLYKSKIIHCDLKPENILLKNISKSGIKLIDLGSSCFVDARCYSYLQSRYYRSPEVLFGLDYGTEIDTWSMGCVLAELFLGTPLFPGESELDMVSMLSEVLGLPDVEFIKKCKKKDKYFDFQSDGSFSLKSNLCSQKRIPASKSLQQILNVENADFIDLIEKCLTFDPKKRIKPHVALTHPWIIDKLPKEIMQLYMKDCQELTKEIESTENTNENIIFIEEGLRGKTANSSKENSVERKFNNLKHPLIDTKFKDSFLLKNNKKTIEEKKDEYELFERTNSKVVDQNVKVIPDIKKFRQLRKINYGKKKSITFHQDTGQDYFS